MTGHEVIGRDHRAELVADSSRTVAQLFLPGEGVASTHSRAAEIAARVMAIPEPMLETMALELVRDFSTRHSQIAERFEANAAAVSSRVSDTITFSKPQLVVLGASFTAEFAIEGAALCNPSAVEHPNQSGLATGELRVAVALRSIGEGHLSSISFAEAIIGSDDSFTFVPRQHPLATASVTPGEWARSHFERALQHEHHLNELSSAILQQLPPRFTATAVETALAALPTALRARRESPTDIDKLRTMVSSAYNASFDASTALSQRVLLPVAAEENHGMEDARFVHFTDLDGSVGYRATYTAYDGRDIAPRLITSADLRSFAIHRLAGSAAHNKGMALFPRPVDGMHLALSRTDGENISLARSPDGVIWHDAGIVYGPREPWEVIQTGNCGSPIETPEGWLALTHGVGPMRTYSIGALLLDLDDPTHVIARTVNPLLQPSGTRRDGYVPNVVYSCGGILHNERIFLPLGIGDARIAVHSFGLSELFAAMSRV